MHYFRFIVSCYLILNIIIYISNFTFYWKDGWLKSLSLMEYKSKHVYDEPLQISLTDGKHPHWMAVAPNNQNRIEKRRNQDSIASTTLCLLKLTNSNYLVPHTPVAVMSWWSAWGIATTDLAIWEHTKI